MDFAAVLEPIADRLERQGHPFALAGGLALAAFGIARSTLDLDLLVPAEAREDVLALMKELGYETLHASQGYSNHLHAQPGLGRVDFIYVRGDTRDKIFDGAQPAEGPGGRPVLVPRAEHLAAMKALAMKSDPERRLQDLADIERLLRLPGVDRSEVRDVFERHGMLAFWRELEPPEDLD